MSPERWRHIGELYHAARERGPTALTDADPELRLEVERLLAKDSGTKILDGPAADLLPDSTPTVLAPGSQLGPYQIEARLGSGGMGEVFRAVDLRLGRPVAIKTCREQFSQRFHREARAISSLNHPHICTLYDVGPNYLVMELVEGETLAARLKKRNLSREQTVQYGSQIADALAVAHAKGIVHRDLKPGNIMLNKSGVKVLDFGLAKSPGDETLTAFHGVMGTPAYMAPEQREGKECDARTDIYALGLILREMPCKGLPRQFAHVVERCLETDPADRWQSASDVKLELEWSAVSEPAVSQAGSQKALVWAGRTPRRARLAWALLAIAGAAVLGTWAVRRSGPASPRSTSRFAVILPPSQALTRGGRHVIAISPDGAKVAYVANQQIYLRAQNQLDAAPVRGTDEDPTEVFFSPNGQWLGYFASGHLKKVVVSGGAPITLCDIGNPYGVSWVGDRILIGAGTKGLLEVPAAGGTPKTLVSAQEAETLHGPQLLPGGETLLFTVRTGTTRWDEGQIVVQPLKGGPRKVVVRGGTDGRFLPTGHLVYARDGVLFAAPFDLGRLETTGAAAVMVDGVVESFGGGTGAAQFDASNSGTLVYVAGSATTKRNLVWLDREGKEEVLPIEPRGYVYPRISPDGTRLAIDVREQQNNAVWIWDFAHETLTRLTFEKDALNAVWSPDGKRIIFAAGQGGTRSLFWKSADGTGAAEQLTKANAVQFPQSLSPDSRLLVFRQENSAAGGPTDLMLLPLIGNRQPAPLVESQGSFQQRDGEISPDGRWLAYQSNESGQVEIYVRPFPEVRRGRWQVSSGGGTQPVWSRSGRELYYVTSDQYLAQLSVQSAAGFAASRPATVLDVRQYFVRSPGRSYDISPDGKRFLMIRDSAARGVQAQLVVVENWFDELRSRTATVGR